MKRGSREYSREMEKNGTNKGLGAERGVTHLSKQKRQFTWSAVKKEENGGR